MHNFKQFLHLQSEQFWKMTLNSLRNYDQIMIMTFHKLDTPDVKRYDQAHIGHPGSKRSKSWHIHVNLITGLKFGKK